MGLSIRPKYQERRPPKSRPSRPSSQPFKLLYKGQSKLIAVNKRWKIDLIIIQQDPDREQNKGKHFHCQMFLGHRPKSREINKAHRLAVSMYVCQVTQVSIFWHIIRTEKQYEPINDGTWCCLISQVPSRMQPQPIVQPFFPHAEHLIYPLAIPVEVEGRGVTNVLSGLRAFVDIGVYEGQFWELVAQLAECWQDLAAHSTPEKAKMKGELSEPFSADFQRTCCVLWRPPVTCSAEWVYGTYHEAP